MLSVKENLVLEELEALAELGACRKYVVDMVRAGRFSEDIASAQGLRNSELVDMCIELAEIAKKELKK